MNEDDKSLLLEATDVMNEPTDPTYGWVTCVVSILVNVWSIRLLKMKEDSKITKLVIWDCAINCIISIDIMYFNSKYWVPIQNDSICALKNATLITLGMFNRLVPVAILFLRYIMVCHPVFFINHGREKGIWWKIMFIMFMLCSTLWVSHIRSSPRSVAFLRCMDREEEFW